MSFATTNNISAISAVTRDPIPSNGIEVEVETLRKQVREFFPAEAASSDLSKPEEVIRLAKELLERLWRWEN